MLSKIGMQKKVERLIDEYSSKSIDIILFAILEIMIDIRDTLIKKEEIDE